MSEYEPYNEKSTENSDESTQRTLAEIQQDINHLKITSEHRRRIEKLKSGELDVEELDSVPIYRPNDWESREQYEEIVGGIPGTDGYRGD